MIHLECILVVDDSEVDTFLHKVVIEDVGCTERVESAEHGEAALHYLREAHAGRAVMPDLILLDINMPVMNGWEFLDRCEQDGLLPERTVLVAMVSTSLDPRDAERALRYGCVGEYTPKPLTESALRKILEGLPGDDGHGSPVSS